jgi:hypothetical protein
MDCTKWNCWKDCVELGLKVVFVGVFTWGVCSAVCCMKSCNSQKTCCKIDAPVKQCGLDCVKPCCKK